MAMRIPCSLDAVEGSAEHTCATCDHYESGWNGDCDLSCGLCQRKWIRMFGAYGSAPSIAVASVCMVYGAGSCDEWGEVDDDG